MPFTEPSKSSKDYLKANEQLHDKLKAELKAGGIKTEHQRREAAKAGAAATRYVPPKRALSQKAKLRLAAKKGRAGA